MRSILALLLAAAALFAVAGDAAAQYGCPTVQVVRPVQFVQPVQVVRPVQFSRPVQIVQPVQFVRPAPCVGGGCFPARVVRPAFVGGLYR